MALYSAAALSGAIAYNGFPIVQLVPSPIADPALVMISGTMSTGSVAAQEVFGLERPGNSAVISTSVPFLPEDPEDPPTFTAMATGWVTPPVLGTQPLRRVSAANISGVTAFVWTFPRGIRFSGASNNGLTLFNFTAGGIGINVSAEIDE